MRPLSHKSLIVLAITFVLLALGSQRLCAADISVDEIVDRANKVAYYAGDDGRADVTMVITDKQGRVRNRELTLLRRDVTEGGEQKFYAFFRRPADVRKMVYMVWKHLGRDDDRWLYLPALDLVRRISSSDKRSSFAGTNFVYEDVSGRGIDEDKHELIETTDTAYVLKNTPKNSGSVEFSYYDMWIDKDTFMPVKAEYYDKQGRKQRVVEAVEVKDIQGHPTVVKSKSSDLIAGSNTVAEFKNVQYDIGLTDDIFTERYLRRAPRKWIK